jgi:hypothetical protein
VAIVQSVDKPYRKLGPPLASDPSGGKSRFTEWVNHGAGGHQIRVIGGTYAEEGGLTAASGLLLALRPSTHGQQLNNVSFEILDVDREHPEHRDAEQWNPGNFEQWYRDVRRAIVALTDTTNPRRDCPISACVQLNAYFPAKCD